VLVYPKKHLKWSDQSLLAAIEAVKNGSSVNMAAICHGVPRTTLQDWLTGKPGPPFYLSNNEEANLAEFLEVMLDMARLRSKSKI